MAHDARQHRRAETRIEGADPWPGLAEDGVLGRDREVADDVQHMAAADGVAVDERDDRDGQRPDETLEVEHVQTGHALGVLVAAPDLVALVAAGAEGDVAGSRQDGDPDRGVVADVPERVEHLGHGLRPERVAHLLAVDGDAGDAGARMLVADVLVLADGRPGDGHG